MPGARSRRSPPIAAATSRAARTRWSTASSRSGVSPVKPTLRTPTVDFDLVGRIAFDGLALDATGQLNYAPQWEDAAATFTASAHRHQAEVDLGIRLRGWRDWTDGRRCGLAASG